MTASAANEYHTRTLTTSIDFFGVMGARLLATIATGKRDDVRRAYKDLANLSRLAGVTTDKESIILISVGSDHVGKRFFIFTLAAVEVKVPLAPGHYIATLTDVQPAEDRSSSNVNL